MKKVNKLKSVPDKIRKANTDVTENSKIKRSKLKKAHHEMAFESFNQGGVIKEARKLKNMTQEELAICSGLTKFYISRVENSGSDIRLSTLLKIVQNGLGGKLIFTVEF